MSFHEVGLKEKVGDPGQHWHATLSHGVTHCVPGWRENCQWAQIRSNNALALSTRLELFLNWTPSLPHHVHDKKQKSYSSQQTEEASSKKGGTTDNTVSDPLQHCIRRCSGPPLRILAPPREQFIWNKCQSEHTLFVYTVYLYDLTKESRQRAKLTSSIELQWVLIVWPYHWVMLASEIECLRRARSDLRESDPWVFALHLLCFFIYYARSFVLAYYGDGTLCVDIRAQNLILNPAYAARIPPESRWFYSEDVRGLRRSQFH